MGTAPMTIVERCLLGLLLTLAVLGSAVAPAAAATFEELVQQLGADDFSTKSDAAEALGRLGDTRAVAPLQALSDGRLYLGPDKRVVIAVDDGAKILDAVTQQPVAGLAVDALDKVRANNRLRGVIEASLAGLTLFSPDRDKRLAAAEDALGHPSPAATAALEKALASENDPAVRAAMALSLAGAKLAGGSTAERLAAIATLSQQSDPQVRALLGRAADASDGDPAVVAAAKDALAALERRLALIDLAVNLFQGISLGSVLLLAAIGLSVTFGVMGVINMAHGEMIMLGAYATYVTQEIFRALLPPAWLDAYLVVALPVGFLTAGAVGMALERGVIRFLYGRPLETLLATWGISLVLQQAVRSIFGAPNKEVINPSWMTGGFAITGGFIVTWNRLAIIAFCLIVLGALALILRRSQFGLEMRAVAQNRPMASAMGIATARIDMLTFGLGSGIAGMAGVALSQIGNVSPNLGTFYIVDSFLVVVFGGVGTLAGTVIGAFSLGIVNKLLEPYAGAVLGKVLVLVAIILFIQRRPRGLFALKGRAAEL
jgi:urea transport system permease protein